MDPSASAPTAASAAPPAASGTRPLPRTGAVSGILETLAFFRDPGFAERRFERHGDVFETVLLGQPMVFIRGGAAIGDLLAQGESVEGWWPESVRQLLGSRSLANRNGPAHRARLLARLQQVLEQAPQGRGGLDLLAGGLDEAGLPLGDADLVEQLLLLLFAGYETTASSLSCLMRALLLDPALEDCLRVELDTLPWPPPGTEAPTAYDPAQAPRLDALVQEVLRFTPPVGGFFRRTVRPVALAGVAVPAGRVVQVALAASHRHADGPEAGDGEGSGKERLDLETFRPQRHLEADGGVTLLPFGGGERVCLGKALAELEIRLMVVGLLRQVSLALAPLQDLSLQRLPSPSPRDGLLVQTSS